MDFFSLSRKELQTLCKINKIPANMTNVAMAEALAALQQVERLDEIFNPKEPDAQQFQEKKVVGTPDVHLMACRTSTRRKAVREEHESPKVNVPVTPAKPSSRRRAPAVSTRRKKEAQIPEDEKNGVQGRPIDVPETPAPPTSRIRATNRLVCSNIQTPDGTAVQRAYNTRRSVRLLEKNLSRVSLMDTEDTGLVKIGDVSEDMSNCSQQTEDLAEETEKWPSLQTVSTVVSEKTDELEVTSREKNTDYELGSGAENDVGASLQAEPQEGLRKINYLEPEPHDSNLKLEGCSETCCDESALNKSIPKAIRAGNETETGLLFELEDPCYRSVPENKKCLGTKQDAFIDESEGASIEVTDQDIAALSVEVHHAASMEVTDQDIAGLLPKPSVSNDSVGLKELAAFNSDNQYGNDSAEISALSIQVSNDASKKVTDQDVAALSVEVPDDAPMEVTDQDIACLLAKPSESNDTVDLKELVALKSDNQDGNDSAEISVLSIEVSEDASKKVTGQDVAALSVEVPDDAFVEVTGQYIAGSLPVSFVGDDSVNLKELVACNTDNEDGYGIDSAKISDALVSPISCNTNTLVDSDVIPEEFAVPQQECRFSAETMMHKSSFIEVSVDDIDEVRLSTLTVAPICEQKTRDIPIQSVVADQLKGESHCPAQSEPKDVANDIQTVSEVICIQEDDKNKVYMKKENPSLDELQKTSMRELKKMLKNLTLNGKSNSNSNNVAKELDRKRTALQALPENQMTACEAQNDG